RRSSVRGFIAEDGVKVASAVKDSHNDNRIRHNTVKNNILLEHNAAKPLRQFIPLSPHSGKLAQQAKFLLGSVRDAIGGRWAMLFKIFEDFQPVSDGPIRMDDGQHLGYLT